MPALKTRDAITDIDFTTAAPPAAQVPAVAAAASLPASAPEPTTILNIIERASRDPNVDIDKMERLIAMHERVQNKQQQVEFDNAMAKAQEEMQPIRTDMENKQTHSRYASYAQLDAATRPIYSKHGFALSFNTGDAPNPNEVRVLCVASHRGGHRQDYKIDMPADGKGPQGAAVMTRTHATGAAASYGQRYLLKLIFNLAVGDVDDDGNGAGGDDLDGLGSGPLGPDGKPLSTYDVAKVQRAKEIADRIIQSLNLSANKQVAKEIWAEENTVPPKKRQSPLDWLRDNGPGQFKRVQTCYENVVGLE